MSFNWQSIRVRLSVQYSAVVFGLGSALLGLVYLAIRRWLESQTMMGYIFTGQQVVLSDGRLVIMPEFREVEIRAIETVYNQVVLDRVARFTLVALIALFMLSIVVGWVMSGRVLRPVEAITNVAREIQASDLSRRIDLDGPDDELTRLANTFDSMLGRLDRAFSSQKRFLADTSHDLRTPLAVIRSNVELVESDPEATIDDWKSAGAIIRRNAEKMSRMIEDLLAAARFETGKAQAVTLDLADLVSGKATEFQPMAIEKGVELDARTAAAVVEGVDVALDRALSNLMENACRVAPPGSRVVVGCGVEEGWAWMAVEDEGPGIDAPPGEGRSGLGLSIVTQIAEGHGGVLATYPGRSGKGTLMVVWLPTASAGDSPPDHPPAPAE
ncbi:MAG: sensor histidine kinase [Acidimicrobiia bacterium]